MGAFKMGGKEMEGGNEATIGSGITQFAEDEQTAAMCAYPNVSAENHPRMDSALGVQLDGAAVKKKRKPPRIFGSRKAPPTSWFAGVFARHRNKAPLTSCDAAENLTGSRTKSATEK